MSNQNVVFMKGHRRSGTCFVFLGMTKATVVKFKKHLLKHVEIILLLLSLRIGMTDFMGPMQNTAL